MITRIVKLTFKEENISQFLTIWKNSRKKIAAFEGCYFVEMLQTENAKHICFTYSLWESEVALNAYRHSELFQHTWAKTKVLFDDKPEAWSTKSQGFEGQMKKISDEAN